MPPLPEGCFALVPLEEATEPLVRVIREFRPHVMTTYDESGGYPHPDHVSATRSPSRPSRPPATRTATPSGRAVAAAQALLPPLVQPAADAGAARGDAAHGLESP